MITYNTDGVKMPSIKKRENTAWVKAVAASYGKRVGEIAYIFVDDEKILEVNRQYLGHDYYTDIITFDYCEGDVISGDLFISLDTVWNQPKQMRLRPLETGRRIPGEAFVASQRQPIFHLSAAELRQRR